MSDINVGINVIWDNQKQMEAGRASLLGMGKDALKMADNFGTTDKEINAAFAKMLPNIKTSTQALKVFSTEGYKAWASYQKEVDESTKGAQKATSKYLANMQAGFEVFSKTLGTTKDGMTRYRGEIYDTATSLEKLALENKKLQSNFKANDFLAIINKNKMATAAWGNETVALSQAMDAIAKKGTTLELGNATGKHTKALKLLRAEYVKLEKQQNTTSVGKFNKMLNQQFSYTEKLSGSVVALKEKYKTLDNIIRSSISSGDTKNLSYYNTELNKVSSSLSRLETLSAKFDKEGFFTGLNKNTEALESMDGRLVAVTARMKALRTTMLKFADSENMSEKETKELRAEYAKLGLEQKKLQKETNGTKQRISNLIKSFVSAQAIVWLVRSTFMKLINTFKEASLAAAEAEETINLFEVVFEGVGDQADIMAKSMSVSFGVATSSIKQGLSTLGDFSEGLGMSNQAALDFSTSLTERMLDVISFKNVTGDTTDILKNLASGLAGNTENFRTWGVVIKESSVSIWLAKNNMDKLTGTALELAKVQARAALFMEQTTNASGDMARTFESTVNVTRRLKEANKQLMEDMGVGFNNTMTPIKKDLLKLVEMWNDAAGAKKAYAGIDVSGEDIKAQQAAIDSKILAYIKPSTEIGYNDDTSAGEIVANQIANFIDTIAVGPLQKLMNKTLTPILSGASGGLDQKAFNILVDEMGGSIETVTESLKRLGISYTEELVNAALKAKADKARGIADAKVNQALDDFTKTVESWSLLGEGGLGQSIGSNLSAQVTSFQSYTGTTPDDTTLAQAYQSELQGIIESAANTLIKAQVEGNLELEKSAQVEIDLAVKQYKEAQAIIDKEAKIAEQDAANATALATAISSFQSSMDNITDNILLMNTNLIDMVRNSGISASMLGQDSSLVSVAQNRASALSGAKTDNLAAQQDFATLHGGTIDSYKAAQSGGYSETAMENMPGFKEWVALVEGQAESLKKTNTYYDLIEGSTKTQLAYSDAENDISMSNLKAYREAAVLRREELVAMVERGEITAEYASDEVAIMNDKLSTLRQLNFDSIQDTIDGLSSISTTKGLDFGTGILSSSNNTYKDNIAALDKIRATVVESSGGIENVSMENTDLLTNKLKDIEEAYKTDKTQALLDATGISSSPDMQLFENIKSIMTSNSSLEVKLAESLLYVISTFDSFQDAMSLVTDSLAALEPIVDSFLSPIMIILEPLTNLLGNVLTPILKAFFPYLKIMMLRLLPVIAAIDTVIVWLGALSGMIQDIVTFNWGHIDDNFTDAADETVEIWENLNDNLAEVANMTMDAADDIAEANEDYIDAINDMLGSGILTGYEALSLVAKNAGSTYTGDYPSELSSDAYKTTSTSTSSTVSIGNITIDATGLSASEIADEIRKLNAQDLVTGGVAS